MPLLNPYLRAFFRSILPAQCTPVQDYILLVPTTEILTNTRDRESGSMYVDLVGVDEFLGSHVLRIPNSAAGAQNVSGRETRGKARQFTTFNGRTVVVKDTWVYSNKGFRNYNQAQLLHDTLYYPDVSEPQQWLIYMISKPLIGSLEYVPTIPPFLRERSTKVDPSQNSGSPQASGKKKVVRSFNELLVLFPMIARQMQPGLEKLFQDFEISFERFKPLQLPPSSPVSSRSGTSHASSRASSVRSTVTGDIYRQAADESEIRRSLESAITAAVDLFQRVDQSQLDLLASTTDLTGSVVDRLIERYIAEQLHDTTLFPRLCVTQAIQDDELEHKILEMENIDLTQVGIPSIEQQETKSLLNRIARGILFFGKIGSAKSPHAMVEHLLDTARTLTKVDDGDVEPRDSVGIEEKSTKTVVTMNADMLVSLLLIVVIRAKVPNLHACLSYMRNFVFVEDVEQGEMGYILSTLEAVLFHIAQNHTLRAASRANEKLWRSVKQGNIKGAKKILEKDMNGEGNEEVPSSGDISDEDESLLSGVDGLSFDSARDDDSSSLEHTTSPNEVSSPVESLASDSGTNGISNRIEGTPAIRPSTNSLWLEGGLSNGTVHISDAAPIRIPREDPPEEEEDHEAGTDKDDQEAPIVNAASLDKEGPPPSEDAFDAPTSPSTGVSNVRIEELRTSGNDDADSINSIQVQPSKPLPNPRIAITRFDVQGPGRPSSIKLRFPRTRSLSAGSVSSIATISDVSISSMILSRTSTSQSQARGAFSAEKLSKTRNFQGESLLMMAIQHKKSEMLRYLLESPFFDVDFVLEDVNNDGATLLSAAVQVQDIASVDTLLEELLRLSDEVLERYLQRPDIFGRTVAHHLFCVPDLISRLGQWLPWRRKDKNGQTPLFALCRSYDHQKYREMVGMAIKQAQASQQDNAKLHLNEHVDSKGNTLLHIAGDPGVARMLLRCDSDVNAINDKGFTPLMVASKYGRVEMVRTFFGDARVDLLARELRGLTAVELAKDDDVRNRIDDLVLFQNPPADDGRVTAVVRSFFVEDATIRVVLKSGAPSAEESSTFTVTTCRRSLTDFQFLAKWLQFENPASWLPALSVSRSPYQIPSKPSRAVLRDIQLRVNSFLRTLLMHPTFSTHELLWEFFLVPEMQQESLIERSKKKAEARAERVREEFTPIEDVREVEMFVSFAKDSIRSINYACSSVTRRATVVRTTIADLPETYKNTIRHLNGLKFLQDTPQLAALTKLIEVLTPSESHPYNLFLEDLRNIQTSLAGVASALERPRQIINEISALQKQIDRHIVSLRRSDRWPLGLLDETRAKYHQEAAAKAQTAHRHRLELASELRYTQSVAAQELAAFHEMHTKQARRAIRELARKQVVAEKDRLEGMKRALKGVRDTAV